MSGIAGIFNLDGRPVDENSLRGMVSAIAHRGPDESAVWVQDSVGLGHCQLHITPESVDEHQPLALGAGNYVLVCDGRVDNRRELIAALQPGAPVTDRTPDANLILHAYMRWGEECPQHIVGDFAFVIWDQRERKLFCARDPMGVRTFYYYRDERRFIFASDIQAIVSDPSVPHHLNQLKVAQVLLGNLSDARETMVNQVCQILPAHALTVTRRAVSERAFWEPSPWNSIKYGSQEEYVEHFRQVFFDSVQSRLRGISPVGISLSGGMDSTSVASAAGYLIQNGQAPGARLEAFSSVFNDYPKVDESKYIRPVLAAWGIQGHPLYADDLWGFKPLQNQSIPWNYPYPLSFQARHEALLTSARENGVQIILTGEGGDELLNTGVGYLIDLLRGLRWRRFRREMSYLDPRSHAQIYRKAIDYHKAIVWNWLPGPAQKLYGKLRQDTFEPWINPDFIRESGVLQHPGLNLEDPKSRSVYRQGQYVGPVSLSRGPFIPYITEMYARHQVEARHPFLDRRVVDFLTRVPPQTKMAEGWNKLLLREAMQGILPDEVRLRRSKSDFAGLTAAGFRNEEGWLRGLLEGGFLARTGWVDKREIKKMYDQVLAGDRFSVHHLTPLVNLEMWLTNYFASNGSGTSNGSLYSSIST